MNVQRMNQTLQILAKDVEVGDIVLTSKEILEDQILVLNEVFELEKHLVINIRYCNSNEIGNQINIRTESLNLVVNDIWSTSKFYMDGGDFVHRIIVFSSKIHFKLGQYIFNVFYRYSGLSWIISNFH